MIIKKVDNPGRLLGLEETKQVKSGLVVLKPGENVGLHITEKREEVIVILEGNAMVEDEKERQNVTVGQIIYIPPETKHNVTNIGDNNLRYIYIVNLYEN